MTNERLERVCEQVAKTVERMWSLGDNRENWAPMLHVFPGNEGEKGIVVLVSGCDLATDLGRANLRELAHQTSLGVRAYAVVFFAEGWQKRGPAADRALAGEEPMPRSDPEHSEEILMALVDSRDGKRGLRWPILREPDGRRRLGALDDNERNATTKVSGWYAELLHPDLKLS